MDKPSNEQGPAGAVVLSCTDLDATSTFFKDRLGFRLDAVFPADEPRVAELSGRGLHVRLERGPDGPPVTLRLPFEPGDSPAGAELVAPNGTRLLLVAPGPAIALPPLQPSLVVTRASDPSGWSVGRAGMEYRDLIPGRQGGRFIASHIRIPTGGPVGDWVHFHRIRFQLIYCYRGWVRVVYEDQGEPFVLQAGDCVLQPPEIRHRVLECSDGLEVVEVGCPAEHETRADHELDLPTQVLSPERDFGGQRFLLHEVSGADWRPWAPEGFEARDLGIAAASGGIVRGLVARRSGDARKQPGRHDGELHFTFLLEGTGTLHCEGREAEDLVAGDSWTIPAGLEFHVAEPSSDFEILEISVPAADGA